MRELLIGVIVLSVGISAEAQVVVPQQFSLAEAIRLAEARNPDLRAARSTVDAARADRLTAGLRPNPAVTFASEGYPLFQSPRPSFLGNQELSARFDQEFETAGRRALRLQGADVAVSSAESRYQDAVRRLALLVQRAYLQAALAWTERQAARNVLEDIDQTITLTKARVAQGETAGAELRRLQVERLKFADDVFTAELALQNARAELLSLVDAPDLIFAFQPTDTLDGPLVLMGTPPSQILLPAELDAPVEAAAIRAHAIASRPDLRATGEDKQRADMETRLQRALRTPNVTFGAGYKRDFGTHAVLFGATVPLPFSNRNQGAIARAAAELNRADSLLHLARNAVLLDVQQALNSLAVSRQRVTYIEKEYLASAGTARDIALASYRLGAGDLLEYLDAQRVYRDTLRTYNRALYDARLSLFQLAAASSATVAGLSGR